MYGVLICGSRLAASYWGDDSGRCGFRCSIWPLPSAARFLVAPSTQPIKIRISESAVSFALSARLSGREFRRHDPLRPISAAGRGRMCRAEFHHHLGRALSVFYVYLGHRSKFDRLSGDLARGHSGGRVLQLRQGSRLVLDHILFRGKSATQGFLHDFAGLLMFAVALIIGLCDRSARRRHAFVRRSQRDDRREADFDILPRQDGPPQNATWSAVLLRRPASPLGDNQGQTFDYLGRRNSKDIVPEDIGRWSSSPRAVSSFHPRSIV